MAARAIWKGYLRLSLVSCAVALYPAASSTSRIRFNTLNRKTGNRVKIQYVDAETGEVVERDDQVKGYQIGKGSFITVEEDELDALKIESTETIDIQSFVPRSEVDERYLDRPYYIVPDDRVAQEPFAVIRDAIREKGMASLARVVMQRRERLVIVEPLDQGLIGTTLNYAGEIRDHREAFEGIPKLEYPPQLRTLALQIIEQMAGHFDATQFEDRYENAVVEMLKAKQAGQPLQVASAERPSSNVVNLMDALKKSLAAEKAPAKKADKAPARERAKASPASSPKAAGAKGKTLRKTG